VWSGHSCPLPLQLILTVRPTKDQAAPEAYFQARSRLSRQSQNFVKSPGCHAQRIVTPSRPQPRNAAKACRGTCCFLGRGEVNARHYLVILRRRLLAPKDLCTSPRSSRVPHFSRLLRDVGIFNCPPERSGSAAKRWSHAVEGPLSLVVTPVQKGVRPAKLGEPKGQIASPDALSS